MSDKFYDSKKVSLRSETFKNLGSSLAIENAFFESITEDLPTRSNVLDIGTGDGFVLREINKRLGNMGVHIYGVDVSYEMIKVAKEQVPNATFIEGDNYALPFEDGLFDIVVAKNVTRFSPAEVFRVLAKNGRFVMREYGLGKGLVEIAEMFKGRIIRSRDPSFYINGLQNIGFVDVCLKEFNCKREYLLDNLIQIMNSFPFIENYSKKDEDKIKQKYLDSPTITITSDPILIVGRKQK